MQEVRSAFKSADEINGASTAKLSYLSGCIKEGLRIFPPSTYGLPRISHGVTISGHYVPKGVRLCAATYLDEVADVRLDNGCDGAVCRCEGSALLEGARHVYAGEMA